MLHAVQHARRRRTLLASGEADQPAGWIVEPAGRQRQSVVGTIRMSAREQCRQCTQPGCPGDDRSATPRRFSPCVRQVQVLRSGRSTATRRTTNRLTRGRGQQVVIGIETPGSGSRIEQPMKISVSGAVGRVEESIGKIFSRPSHARAGLHRRQGPRRRRQGTWATSEKEGFMAIRPCLVERTRASVRRRRRGAAPGPQQPGARATVSVRAAGPRRPARCGHGRAG